jgi:hypothetical protein
MQLPIHFHLLQYFILILRFIHLIVNFGHSTDNYHHGIHTSLEESKHQAGLPFQRS